MRWVLIFLVLMVGYMYYLMHTTDTLLGMTKQLEGRYTSAAQLYSQE